MSAFDLNELVVALRASRGFEHKRDIADAVGVLARALPGGLADTTLSSEDGVLLGDDCAAIPDAQGDGHLLLAIEGLVDDFVARMPWFAGYSAIMVNLSDIAAMGGRPIAVVDALWSDGAGQAEPILQGMAAASAAYGVPIVGGHSNHRAARGQLAVAVLGRAKRLLSSFAARPGEQLLMAVDLRGRWEEPYPFWNASTTTPAERLRADLALLPELAEAGLCRAAKDISMAGCLGTALMLLECSRVGAVIDVDRIPCPSGFAPGDACHAHALRWLTAFPSYGYLLSVAPSNVTETRKRFQGRGIACEAIGEITAQPQCWLRDAGGGKALLWDLAAHDFIGARARETFKREAA